MPPSRRVRGPRSSRKPRGSRAPLAPRQDTARGQLLERRLTSWRLGAAALVAITLIAYANAWPDNLTFDDRVFVDAARYGDLGLAGFERFFTEDLWAASGTESRLYRPLLLVSIAVQTWLFGEWLPGYHLVNILLHALATVLVFGLVRHVLETGGYPPRESASASLLSAVVFGVHPIHAEVVNSVFNGSEIYVCIGIAGGLLWFLRALEREPAKAWLGLNLIYLLALLFRESAVSLPALAVMLILVSWPESWPARCRRCLPAVTLLVPLVLYLALRGHALEGPVDPAQPAPARHVVEAPGQADSGPAAAEPNPAERWSGAIGRSLEGMAFTAERVAPALVLWFESWKIVLWPHPLQVFYDQPDTSTWLAIAVQFLLLSAAVAASAKGRSALLAGVAFFYLAILPSSQIFGETASAPGLADRILYLPSAGMAIALAAGWGLILPGRIVLTAATAMALAMVLVPVTWTRNSDWRSDTTLFERDYRKLEHKEVILDSLLAAHLREGNIRRVTEICDKHAGGWNAPVTWGIHCGSAYGRRGRFDDAARAYLAASRFPASAAYAHANLATMYVYLGQRKEAEAYFERAIASEPIPFLREYFHALMLIQLHPGDRSKLIEARSRLVQALELQPQHVASRAELERLDAELDLETD